MCVAIDTWHVTEIRPFGSNPCPRHRMGCALVGSEILICGGTSPMKVERMGDVKEILHDHSDVHILHLGEWLVCYQGCTYVVVVFPLNLTY